nr:hypothetical protein GCM10020093_076970 [Planobispora longispora]
MVVPWVLGFAAWWMLAALPIAEELKWWTGFWTGARELIGFVPQPWMSAAVGAFLVSGLVTLALGVLRRR